MELRNESKYEFIKIAGEVYRKYIWVNLGGFEIKYPEYLAISKSGHRILDVSGNCYFIPFGWDVIQWGVNEDAETPHFVL